MGANEYFYTIICLVVGIKFMEKDETYLQLLEYMNDELEGTDFSIEEETYFGEIHSDKSCECQRCQDYKSPYRYKFREKYSGYVHEYWIYVKLDVDVATCKDHPFEVQDEPPPKTRSATSMIEILEFLQNKFITFLEKVDRTDLIPRVFHIEETGSYWN